MTLRSIKIVISIFSFLIGGIIYMAYRSTDLLMFTWFSACGLDYWVVMVRNTIGSIPSALWVRYCLPDALWLLSYLLLVDSIWNTENKNHYYFWLGFLPVIAVGSEILQYFIPRLGVFDWGDMLAYCGVTLFFITKNIYNEYSF